MKSSFSIVYFGDIYDVNGVNYVSNFFVEAKNIFLSSSIPFNSIYCKNGVIDVEKIDSINIGKDVNTKTYFFNRLLRNTLSKIFDSKYDFNAWFKVKNSLLNPANAVINDNLSKINQEKVILFQDIFTAYYFLIHENRNTCVNTVLLLHCSEEPFEQLLSYYPSLKTSKYFKTLENIKNLVYEKIDKVIFLSKSTLALNSEISDKASYIYNGISDLKKVESVIDEYFNITCVGSLVGRKGQEILIDSLNLLPKEILAKTRLHIIGGGPQESELKQIVRTNNLDNFVIFYGIRNDISELLRRMDVMVLASKSEGMPISIIEGMRQGMYILATDVGAIKEMINPTYGQLIERTAEDIKNKLVEVYNLDKKEYKTKSREAFLEKFTLEKMTDNYIQLFKGLSCGK